MFVGRVSAQPNQTFGFVVVQAFLAVVHQVQQNWYLMLIQTIAVIQVFAAEINT